MVDLRRDVWRRCGRADLLSILAPGMEPTTGGGRQKAWRASRNRFETAALTLDARERSKETLGVRVESTTEDVVPGTLLDDLPGIHDRNPIRHLRDDGDIVGDDDDRHMKALLECQDFIHDLCRRYHVEGRRRLVHDHELGIEGERHRDIRSLLHA